MLWLITVRHEINEGGADDTWYDAWEEEKAEDYEEYIDSIFWATATMTSIAYGDIVPLTKIEFIVCIFVMILGASTYGSIFGTFVVIIDDMNSERKEREETLETLKRWIEVRNLSKELRIKLINYIMRM